jgi:uncharacterized protein involved in exopolysaccharide biosynthesis/Mrp family chromosome partitioning ATPase
MEGSVASRTKFLTQGSLSGLDAGMRRPLHQRMEAPTPFHQLVVVIARGKWFVLSMVLLGGILGGLAGLSRPVLFEATTQIIIDAPNRSAGGTESVQDLLDSSIDDHLTMLSSQAHLRRVLAVLREMKTMAAGKNDTSTTPADQAITGSLLDDLLNRGWSRSGSATTRRNDVDGAGVRELRNGVRVGQELRSRVITIGFTDSDPARAALVANTFAQVYIDDLKQTRRALDQQELGSLVASLPQVQGNLVEATDRLETYRLTHGAVDQSAADNAANEAAELNRQISLSKADLSAAQSRRARIRELQKSAAPDSAVAAELASPVLTDLVTRQSDAAADKDLSRAIDLEIEHDIARLDAEANIYRAQVAALEERKKVLDAVVADTASRLSGLRALEPQVAIVTQRYNDLLGRQQDLIRRIAAPSPGVRILSAAWPPTSPKTLPWIFVVPPAMIVFGLIGAAFVMVRNHFNKSLRSQAEAEALLGVPCVGLLPRVRRVHAKHLRHLVLGQQNSVVSRAVMSLLVHAAPTQRRHCAPQIILVTSSVQDDGKTELAWSLALAATRLGRRRVLFLDLDRNDRRLSNEFSGEFSTVAALNSFGDYVSRRCALKDAITTMPGIGIDLMAPPAPSDDMLTLLASADSSQCKEELHSLYQVVIINGPSGLAIPETGLLKHWADAMLFAVRWGGTRRSVARTVLDQLQVGDATSIPVGSVLTQVNLRKHAGYRFEDSADLLLERS